MAKKEEKVKKAPTKKKAEPKAKAKKVLESVAPPKRTSRRQAKAQMEEAKSLSLISIKPTPPKQAPRPS